MNNENQALTIEEAATAIELLQLNFKHANVYKGKSKYYAYYYHVTGHIGDDYFYLQFFKVSEKHFGANISAHVTTNPVSVQNLLEKYCYIKTRII